MSGTKQKTKNRKIVHDKLADENFWNKLFIAIGEEGLSLTEYCALENVHYNKVAWKLKSDVDLQSQYACAREIRALKNAEKIDQLASKVENELIKPDAGRVAIDARKWLASRLDPAQFGDKIESTVKVVDMNQVYLNELKDLMRTKDKPVPKVINE